MTTLDSLHHLLDLPSPVERLDVPWTGASEISLDIKRDDMIHPLVSGNKWRKLKYNLIASRNAKSTCLVAFGGAFSNLLVAVATLGHMLGMPTVGIVRGYKLDESNPTIKILRAMGMTLHLISPKAYKLKNQSTAVQDVLSQYPGHYLIPEGGTNEVAVRGMMEIYDEIPLSDYDYIVTAIGTGGTLAGLVQASDDRIKVLGISPFKEEISHLAGYDHIDAHHGNYRIVPSILQTSFGGYDQQISSYINAFYEGGGLLLDPVYTAKAMMTLQHLVGQRYFSAGARILFIHTGGLQGILGYNYMHHNKMASVIAIPPELETLRTYE